MEKNYGEKKHTGRGPFRRVFIIILDGLGVGALPDAYLYGDQGSNTLGNIARAMGGLCLPAMEKMGLGNIIPVQGVKPREDSLAAYGKMAEKSAGKDTITGHWEMAGLILKEPFPLYPRGFPPEIMGPFEAATGREALGNKVASGTVIIEELGPEHLQTGGPIVYTSADSVFQVAAHQGVVPLEQLYRWCRSARELLTGEHRVGRVIARPFTGTPGSFQRTGGRKDFPIEPTAKTVLNLLQEKGKEVVSVGKIKDIFAGSGITRAHPTRDNREGIETVIKLAGEDFSGLAWANLVDFDTLYGHRNDPLGYYRALQEFDGYLPRVTGSLGGEDLLIITADHGCDPTFPGTDHTREYVPLLAYHRGGRAGVGLGTRSSFADVAATLGEIFDLAGVPGGESFYGSLR